MIVSCSSSLKAVIVGVVLSLNSFCTAQSHFPESVKASYDPSGIPEVMNTVPIGFTFDFQGNSKESTKGFLNGRIRWNSLEVSSPQGTIHDGLFTFDRKNIWKNNHEAAFNIKMGGKIISCSLSLPYVEKLRFNLYTDSLKRGEPFYLNVEGKFNSGRVYPLDTGMASFSKSGGGKLNGQSLLVSRQDTEVHAVKVYVWLKADSQIKDSILIPIKILPNPASLPTEQQVLHEQ